MKSEMQRRKEMLANPDYDPDALFDYVSKKLGARSDKQLSQMLGIHQTVISRARNRYKGISSNVLLQIHDATGISIRTMRELLGLEKISE